MQNIFNLFITYGERRSFEFIKLKKEGEKKMTNYIVNKHTQIGTGYNKIHKIDCKRVPKPENRVVLHNCICPIAALNKAQKYFKNVSGCKYCCKEIS